VTGMALAHCILGKFLGVVCHCFPPSLDVPTLAARRLRPQRRERSYQRKVELWARKIPKFRLPREFKDLLHAANLRHGTDGFTSPPWDASGGRTLLGDNADGDTAMLRPIVFLCVGICFSTVLLYISLLFFLWRCGPMRTTAASFFRLPDHTHRRTTLGRTRLEE